MTMKLCPVILAGGFGVRLWPLSRQQAPKPFIQFGAEQPTLFQQTAQRLNGLPELTNSIVVCNQDHRFYVSEQLETLNQTAQLLLEPLGRNTAPALTLAALWMLAYQQDDIMLVLPADHLIQNQARFHEAVVAAVKLAEQDHLVTFGVVPNQPHTGYGYIKKGDQSKVEAFVEKPDLETAKAYMDSGNYLWNSGMFVMKASVWLNELKAHASDMFSVCEATFASSEQKAPNFWINKESFENCPSDSIDYAVMEKTSQAAVVPLDAQWSDVGDWAALQATQQDQDGNWVQGDVVSQNTKNSLLMAQSRLLTTSGLEGMIVVETADAVLVAPKDQAQNIKPLVDQLSQHERTEVSNHVKVHKPWGSYQVLDVGEGFQVKRLTVHPGAALSLQAHNFRVEHWVVVTGTARVTVGDEIKILEKNEAVYIPPKARHRLENPGNVTMELIEVQLGSYLGEDDIIRFEDEFDRIDH